MNVNSPFANGQRCDCDYCNMMLKYLRIVAKLPAKDRAWMESFLEGTHEHMCTLVKLENYVAGLSKNN